MQIVLAAQEAPYPVNNGLRVRTANVLRVLARRHEVHLVAHGAGDAARDAAAKAALGAHAVQVTLVPPPTRWLSSAAAALDLALGRPPSVRHYRSEALRRALEAAAATRPDVAHLEGIVMAQYRDAVPRGHAAVTCPVDSLSLALQDETRWMPHVTPARAAYTRVHRRAVRAYERNAYPRFHRCQVVSPVDAAHLRRLAPGLAVDVITNGVDLAAFAPTQETPEPNTAIYVGYMAGGSGRYLRWFLEEVWACVRTANPAARLTIVGTGAPPRVLRAAEGAGGVAFAGFVPDLRPVYARHAVAVCPVLKSCGILNKRLEPLAMGLPVVGTAIGFSGFPGLQDGEHAMAAATPQEFAEHILSLFADPARGRQIGRAGRAFVEKNHDWNDRLVELEASYHQAIAQAGSP